MTPRPSRNSGFTLLEILAYCVILLVVLNVSAQIFVTCVRLCSLGTRMSDRAAVLQQIEEQFVADVRAATRVVEQAGTYRTGPDMLVLEVPASDLAVRTYVVFGTVQDPKRLGKIVLHEKNGAVDSDSLHTYPLDLRTWRFDYADDGGSARLVTLELTPEPLRPAAHPGDPVHIAAAPRALMDTPAPGTDRIRPEPQP